MWEGWHGGTGFGNEGRTVKVLEVTNVDFSLRHFLVPLMRGVRGRGHEVVGVCADGGLLAEVRAEGFRVEVVPMARSLSPLAQWRALRALVRLMRVERPDLVHAHMPISGFLARVAAWWCGVPRVAYTCHGFLFQQPGPWWRRGLGFVVEWVGGRLTRVFMTVSQEEAGVARRWGIHPGAVGVGNGRDPAVFRPDPVARARVRGELGCASDAVVVVIVSRLVRHKGHPELVAAMREVPGAELWVVGERLESDHGADMGPVYAGAGLGGRLRMLGYRGDTAAVLAAADLFVLPSQFEGLPMSVIEAMLVGLAVVATAISGPREQVVDGATGVLVAPGDVAGLAGALRRLVGDAGLRGAMGAAGRARALALYDEGVVVGRVLDLLRL